MRANLIVVIIMLSGVFSVAITRFGELEQRIEVAGQLEALGVDPVTAREQALELTANDLAVLAANPLMMQRAGDSSQRDKAIFLTVLVVVAIVALSFAAGGGVSVG
ncbi:MAG: hypothetical protein ACF8PN_02040 [Phycisphaerales bacterium]